MKIAAAQYFLKKHQSINDYVESVSQWVEEAANNQAELLLFPEYGSIEMVSMMSPDIQKNLSQQLLEIQNNLELFIDLYQQLACAYNITIVAPSFPLLVDLSTYVNRAFVFNPQGEIFFQDKQMMTRFEDEQWKISSPKKSELTFFKVNSTRVGISICFDIEFPDFSRSLCQKGVDIILAPSCTETIHGMNRVHVGAKARALENQCLVVVSQTVGLVDYSEAIDLNNGYAAFYAPSDVGFPEDGTLAKGELNAVQWLYYEYNQSLFANVRTNGAVFNFKKISQLPKLS